MKVLYYYGYVIVGILKTNVFDFNLLSTARSLSKCVG